MSKYENLNKKAIWDAWDRYVIYRGNEQVVNQEKADSLLVNIYKRLKPYETEIIEDEIPLYPLTLEFEWLRCAKLFIDEFHNNQDIINSSENIGGIEGLELPGKDLELEKVVILAAMNKGWVKRDGAHLLWTHNTATRWGYLIEAMYDTREGWDCAHFTRNDFDAPLTNDTATRNAWKNLFVGVGQSSKGWEQTASNKKKNYERKEINELIKMCRKGIGR